MATIAELLIRLGVDSDDVEEGFDDVEDRAETSAASIAAGFGVAGAAVEGLARSQQDLTVSTGRVASSTELTADEVRGLATDLSNATFPLADVLALMELASQQGITGAEDLANYANFWDMVGDATGESAVSLAEGGVALRAIGIAAGEEGEALDAFGFIAQSTTQDVGEFLKFIDRTGPELRDLGADVDDTAAIMGILESEFGMTSRTARQEFRKAVRDSDGTLDGLLSTLGISEDQFSDMRSEVADSGGAIEEWADNVADSKTPLQEIQSGIEDWLFENGELLGQIANMAPLLMGLATAIGVVTVAQGVWNAVMAANPLFLVIGAIAILVGILATLGIGVDDVVNAFKTGFDIIKGAVEGALNWISDNWPLLLAILTGPIGAAVLLIVENWDTIKEAVSSAIEFIRGIWNSAVSFVKEKASEAKDWITDRFDDVVDFFAGLPETIRNIFEGLGSSIVDGIKAVWNNTVGGFGFTVPGWVPAVGGREFRIPELAAGGIVTRPTLALIGEAGPEAVIPLDLLSSETSAPEVPLPRGITNPPESNGGSVVVNVQGNVVTERELVAVIRDELNLGGMRGADR